jgi:hypothetical protein
VGTLTAGANRTVRLFAEQVVGRDADCALCLQEKQISRKHALIRWNGADWTLRDLGSVNGTFVDGARLDVPHAALLREGMRVQFGGDQTPSWRVLETSAPPPVALPVHGGEASWGTSAGIELGEDDDAAFITRDGEHGWILTQGEKSRCVERSVDVTVAGVAYHVLLPIPNADPTERHEDLSLRLDFAVSTDEEHVEVEVVSPRGRVSTGARSHNYLLLTLARRRAQDRAEGYADAECGWTYADELGRSLGITLGQLNLHVHRIRRQLESLNVPELRGVIERRPGSGQMRLGLPCGVIRRS